MKGTTSFVGERVGDDSIWAVLHRECHVLFPDELFADLFTTRGRRSVPPRIVATVMVLQRWFGLSDREAVQAFEFDARWKFACGGLDFDYPGFVHTVLVDMRARLDRSKRPKRIFEVTLDAARAAGVVSAKRVLDSTPLYDAVATQDTVTMIRSAIRQLLAAADSVLEAELGACCAVTTNATLAAESGAPLPALMARLGHASAAAAIRYQHRVEGQDERVADFLEQVGRSALPPREAAG